MNSTQHLTYVLGLLAAAACGRDTAAETSSAPQASSGEGEAGTTRGASAATGHHVEAPEDQAAFSAHGADALHREVEAAAAAGKVTLTFDFLAKMHTADDPVRTASLVFAEPGELKRMIAAGELTPDNPGDDRMVVIHNLSNEAEAEILYCGESTNMSALADVDSELTRGVEKGFFVLRNQISEVLVGACDNSNQTFGPQLAEEISALDLARGVRIEVDRSQGEIRYTIRR